MRILYYSPHPTLRRESTSGYGTHIRSMIRAFEMLGHEVDTLIMGDEIAPAGELPTAPAPPESRAKQLAKRLVPAIAWNSLKDIRLLRHDRSAQARLRAAILHERPDLVYERAAYLQTSGVSTCKALGVPHVLEMNAPYVEEAGILGRGGRSLLRRRAHRAERSQLRLTGTVAIVSSVLRDHLAEKHGVPTTKFVVTPNAIFPKDHAESDLKERRPPQIPPDAPVIGFVGSIFPWHGLEVLIEAFHGVLETGRNCHLLIVGDGAPLPSLKAQVTSLGIGDRVHFTGSVPHNEVFGYLATMDVGVMPRSNWYGSPVKLFEYGALGLPIIAVRNGPMSEVMRDGQHGLLVESTTEALRTAMVRLLSDPRGARTLGEAFRQKVLAQHVWTKNAQTVLASVPWP